MNDAFTQTFIPLLLGGLFGLLLSGLVSAVLACILFWWNDSYCIRDVPGPFLAKFSDGWLAYHTWKGRRSLAVHEAHAKYGKIVRIAPNNISIADSDAIQTVYGFGSGTFKTDWYDVFVTSSPSLFSTRSRVIHARKRKTMSHIYSMKQVVEFEHHVSDAYTILRSQLDSIIEESRRGISGDKQQRGGGWTSRGGKAWLNCIKWYNFLTFDIIGDLAFGKPFGFLNSGVDLTPVIVNKTVSTDKDQFHEDLTQRNQAIKYIPAIEIITGRTEFTSILGLWPKWIRAFVLSLPVPPIRRGHQKGKEMAGLAMASVNNRLSDPEDGLSRVDILRKLQETRDENGKLLSQQELTGESASQIIAGSDTTSNSLAHITYYLAKYPNIQQKVREEIEAAVGVDDSEIVSYKPLSTLPYLSACIHEALRLRPTLSLGLPREVPEGDITLLGRFYKEGTVLGVPTYTIHRDPKVWGEDAEAFRPERWIDGDKTELLKSFNLFSFGPRACIGRNLAMLELVKVVGNMLRRYEFELEGSDGSLKLHEGVLVRVVECRVGISRRNPLKC